MLFNELNFTQNPLRSAITNAYRSDETQCVNQLLAQIDFSPTDLKAIQDKAAQLVHETRQNRKKQGSLQDFLHEYDLSSDEGIALMCLAEALLRIPDNETIDRLISDKISSAAWKEHLSKNGSLFVNAATWSLMLTGKIYQPTLETDKNLTTTLKQLMSRTGGTFIRPVILQGMKIIGKQFVMGTTIQEALKRAQTKEAEGYRYSYDMLGEAARTAEDAERYFDSYLQAIAAVGKAATSKEPAKNPGISVKLSALHPRFEFAKRESVLKELAPKLLTLAQAAKEQNIGLTVDAEEADRLDLSLDVFEAVFKHPSLQGYEGFGQVVQAYQKRAPYVIDWLLDLAEQQQRKIMIRLVKGAYWDSEIKMSQLLGLSGYPVFTRKNSTDVSYIVCAKKLLAHTDFFYPQFGSHNAHTVATILTLAKPNQAFEFQCLHGMGEPLYDPMVSQIPVRIYAPVGTHKDLLGYLVRRLLENGANTSFINHIANEKVPIEKIIMDPIERIANLATKPHPHIPLPRYIYDQESQDDINVKRLNSKGLDLTNIAVITELKTAMESADQTAWEAGPIIAGAQETTSNPLTIFAPSQLDRVVGQCFQADANHVERALHFATDAKEAWAAKSAEERAACLEKAADLFEENTAKLMALLTREGGKQITDCLSEIRETIDFCRYYAARARKDLLPVRLKSPTGEQDELSLHPRGIIACISPWNFPLAIFTGQIVAALVTGNAVIAKPAEQTPLIAAVAVNILHEAGIPGAILQLLPGDGAVIGAALTADERISGVMFTGSTETAKIIQQTLTNRSGPLVPFIAETGGQNCMIVDSSALPEQVVMDVIQSAFNSAGQRCSALRVLFVQEDVAPNIIEMLKGAMAELSIGEPSLLTTDVGPVIDQEALTTLTKHVERMEREANLLYKAALPADLAKGHYFAPCVFELTDLSLLQREVFGPILHIIRYKSKDLDKVLSAITRTNYGLTLGIHSRINATINYIMNQMSVGNIYVNRNMIGAVVGVQPFGGERLSGTGPKAGGPHYLPRLCVERAVSINTTAAGGNATLVSLSEDS